MGEQRAPEVSPEAAAVAAAAERWPQWLHARYETISFESLSSIRRSVRLDFSIPEELAELPGSDWIRIPLIRVPKAEIGSVEVVDEAGARVMVPTSAENRKLTAEMLIAQLRVNAKAEEFRDPFASEEMAADLFALVAEDDRVAAEVHSKRFEKGMETVVGQFAFRSRTGTIAFGTSRFAAYELVFAILPRASGARRVLTLAHEQSISRFFMPGLRSEVGRRHLGERIGEHLGWRDRLTSFRVTDAGISRTLEIAAEVPEGVGVRHITFTRLGREFKELGDVRSTELRAPRTLRGRVTGIPEDEDAHVLAFLRAEPGYPAAVAGASLFSGVVLTAGAFGLDRLNDIADAAVTLLLAGPTLAASLIALPGRNRLGAQIVRGARGLISTVAVATFLAALSLVTISPGDAQCTIWAFLTVLVWMIATALIAAVALRFRQIRRLKEETWNREREKYRSLKESSGDSGGESPIDISAQPREDRVGDDGDGSSQRS